MRNKMTISNEQIENKSTGIDWPLVAFFALAYLLAWGLMPVLNTIAQKSGVEDWIILSQMAESLDFGGTELITPGWLVYLITRIQDFAFSIAGVIVIIMVSGRAGLQKLSQRLINWRIGWRWYLAALIPFGLYLLATILSGSLNSFEFTAEALVKILFSAEAGFLVYFFLRGAMGEELGLRGFALPAYSQECHHSAQVQSLALYGPSGTSRYCSTGRSFQSSLSFSWHLYLASSLHGFLMAAAVLFFPL